jgi:hypothetical protein
MSAETDNDIVYETNRSKWKSDGAARVRQRFTELPGRAQLFLAPSTPRCSLRIPFPNLLLGEYHRFFKPAKFISTMHVRLVATRYPPTREPQLLLITLLVCSNRISVVSVGPIETVSVACAKPTHAL